MSLSPDAEASYIPIIDSILAASNLETISEKRIRKGLQAALDYDITPQKDAIKALIMARFDLFNAKSAPQTNGHAPTANGDVDETPTPKPGSSSPVSRKRPKDEVDEMSDVKDSPIPKKKKKVENDSDAAFAAKLQAQENARMRATRGGGPKKNTPVKKKNPKKKTPAKVKAEDDSDIEESGSEVKERKVNRSGGFHKELFLSAPLSALLDNEVKLSRPQTVKRIWQYVREHDLQDPRDKRQIRCDDAMRAVFKADKIHMFTMNKILAQNLYPDE